MSVELTSAPPPPPGPADHARGPESAADLILYLDLACPHCAADWARIRELPLRLCVRHFPLATRRARSPALHAAAEAAGQLGGEKAFWQMWDRILAEQAYQDDPHLWNWATAIGLDLERFEEVRRSDAVASRVHTDLVSGMRAGTVRTPTAYHRGRRIDQDFVEALVSLAPEGWPDRSPKPRGS